MKRHDAKLQGRDARPIGNDTHTSVKANPMSSQPDLAILLYSNGLNSTGRAHQMAWISYYVRDVMSLALHLAV